MNINLSLHNATLVLAVLLGFSIWCSAQQPPLDEETRSVQPLLEEGMREDDAGNKQRALELFSEAAEKAPGSFFVWMERGILLTRLARFEEAIADLNKAIELKPDFRSSYGVRGMAYYQLKKYPEAITDLSIAPYRRHATKAIPSSLSSTQLFRDKTVRSSGKRLDRIHRGLAECRRCLFGARPSQFHDEPVS